MLDRIWLYLGSKAFPVWGILFFLGFIMTGLSVYLGLHSVKFTGELANAVLPIPVAADGTPIPMKVKEVGFLWAPNWALTALILLPAAIYYLFSTRASIEPLLERLVSSRMLVKDNGEMADKVSVLAMWKKHSRMWTILSAGVFGAVVAFMIVADFIPVVLTWNLMGPEGVADTIARERVTLGHPTYEFDWSIASTFKDARISAWTNIAFDAFAYLIVPVFGSATLFAAMLWFFSTHSFLSHASLRAEKYRLVPNPDTGDPRCGFEVFEEFFSNLIRSAIATALIVVTMHLQNVYLRAPGYSNIFDMVFGTQLNDLYNHIATGEFTKAIRDITTLTVTPSALDTSMGDFAPQTYFAAVALLMLSVIVFGMVWGWLHASAKHGRDQLYEAMNQTGDPQYGDAMNRLEAMKIWPVGWAEVTTLLAIVAIVICYMVWTNFLVVVVAIIIALAAAQLLRVLGGWAKSILPGGTARRPRKYRTVAPSPSAPSVNAFAAAAPEASTEPATPAAATRPRKRPAKKATAKKASPRKS